nr:MAG TPA: hypothetical protein [Caudoviricetes sp.]
MAFFNASFSSFNFSIVSCKEWVSIFKVTPFNSFSILIHLTSILFSVL